jgi:hypothetical protein
LWNAFEYAPIARIGVMDMAPFAVNFSDKHGLFTGMCNCTVATSTATASDPADVSRADGKKQSKDLLLPSFAQ